MIRAPSRIKWTAGRGAPQISTYLRGTLNATSCSEHPEEFHIKKNSYSVLYKGCVLVPETLQSILENQCFFHSQVTITQTIPNSLSHTYKTPIHNAWDKACQLMLLWTPSTIPELWTHELHSEFKLSHIPDARRDGRSDRLNAQELLHCRCQCALQGSPSHIQHQTVQHLPLLSKSWRAIWRVNHH